MNSLNSEKLSILIHHHTIAYVQDDKIWLQSYIGFWVDELSKHFNKIGLILFISNEKSDIQDYCIKSQNITLHPLGTSEQRGRIKRNQKAKSICKKVSQQYSCLIIRGITPRQLLVYKNSTGCKVFYFVGSLYDSKTRLKFDIFSFFQRFMYHLRMIQLRSIFKTSSIITNSPGTVKEVENKFGKAASFISTNSLPKHFYNYRLYRPAEGVVKLLFCGRITQDKGIEDLIYAVKILKDRNVLCHLRVIGTGTTKYFKNLANLIQKESISERVQFTGFIDFGERLMELYKQADLFILPSYHEGFPHVIWEAAASCTPIITTAVGGVSGLISNKEVFFVSPKSPSEIANTIEYIIHHPQIVKKKIDLAYKFALSHTSEHCAEIFAKYVTKFNSESRKNNVEKTLTYLPPVPNG